MSLRRGDSLSGNMRSTGDNKQPVMATRPFNKNRLVPYNEGVNTGLNADNGSGNNKTNNFFGKKTQNPNRPSTPLIKGGMEAIRPGSSSNLP
jgi:hypothetical protein